MVPGEVKAVSVSGLSEARSSVHLLLLLIQHHLQVNNIRTPVYQISFLLKKQNTGLMLYLQVFDHDGVVNILGLQVNFDKLKTLEGNSDVHRVAHVSHSHPDVHLKGQTDDSYFVNGILA